MAFDFKKEYKEFYLPKSKPALVEVPKMNYIAVRGKGDPNAEDITAKRLHHEIYLSDPRKTAPERLKTVIRIPIKKI